MKRLFVNQSSRTAMMIRSIIDNEKIDQDLVCVISARGTPQMEPAATEKAMSELYLLGGRFRYLKHLSIWKIDREIELFLCNEPYILCVGGLGPRLHRILATHRLCSGVEIMEEGHGSLFPHGLIHWNIGKFEKIICSFELFPRLSKALKKDAFTQESVSFFYQLCQNSFSYVPSNRRKMIPPSISRSNYDRFEGQGVIIAIDEVSIASYSSVVGLVKFALNQVVEGSSFQWIAISQHPSTSETNRKKFLDKLNITSVIDINALSINLEDLIYRTKPVVISGESSIWQIAQQNGCVFINYRLGLKASYSVIS
jgi:hypothetical protein